MQSDIQSLVKEVTRRGHEVASHGYSHTKVFQQTHAEFTDDVSRAKKLLEDLTGTAVCRLSSSEFLN
ncbi:MAG: polysaccharide deacetylase family protein [Rheinheimera sp.]|nr:polysaccharide deacetylase family protein [Rheinheimera sp.]